MKHQRDENVLLVGFQHDVTDGHAGCGDCLKETRENTCFHSADFWQRQITRVASHEESMVRPVSSAARSEPTNCALRSGHKTLPKLLTHVCEWKSVVHQKTEFIPRKKVDPDSLSFFSNWRVLLFVFIWGGGPESTHARGVSTDQALRRTRDMTSTVIDVLDSPEYATQIRMFRCIDNSNTAKPHISSHHSFNDLDILIDCNGPNEYPVFWQHHLEIFALVPMMSTTV